MDNVTTSMKQMIIKDEENIELLRKQYYFYISTPSAGIMKKLIEALKDVIQDTTFILSKKGIELKEFHQDRGLGIILFLDANEFEEFYIFDDDNNEPFKKIELGLNIQNLYRLFKNINNTEVIKLCMDRGKRNLLKIIIDNKSEGYQKKYNLNILDLDTNNIGIQSKIDYSSIITLPKSQLKIICSDFSSFSKRVEIKCIGNSLTFITKDSSFGEQIIEYNSTDNKNVIINNKNKNEIIQGYYSLETLGTLSKFTNLNDSVKIYLENDQPIILDFDVGSLGNIKIFIAYQEEIDYGF